MPRLARLAGGRSGRRLGAVRRLDNVGGYLHPTAPGADVLVTDTITTAQLAQAVRQLLAVPAPPHQPLQPHQPRQQRANR